MAASAFTVFKQAKKNLGNAAINLASDTFKLVLIKSNASVMLSTGTSASTWSSLKTDGITEMGEVGGYSSSGETLVNVSWTLSGTAIKFDAQDFSISVTADLSAIRAILIRSDDGNEILCYSSLSSAAFDLSTGNKLIIQFATSGIFVLS
jgi:hypothetical protein